jgi:hypothetical protein
VENPADLAVRCALTIAPARAADTRRMDEPTHANESVFWDQVADWLLANYPPDQRLTSQEDSRAVLRHGDENPDPDSRSH